MRLLPKEYKRKSFIHKLFDRTDKAAIYQVFDENGVAGFEVFKVIIRKAHPKDSDQSPKEALPSDESFGKWAWCYSDKGFSRALDKYNELVEAKENG